MRALELLARRIRALFRIGKLVRTDSSSAAQKVQVDAGINGLFTDIEHLEPYGYTSRPKKDAEVLLASLRGNPGHTVALIIGGRAFRLKDLAEGEVALYDDLGNVVHFQRNKIHVNAVQHLEAIAPTTELISDVTITGTLKVTGNAQFDSNVHCDQTVTGDVDVVFGGISGVGHKHPIESGSSSPGPTGTPV